MLDPSLVQWLASEEACRWFEVLGHDADLHRTLKSLRKELDATRSAALVEQHQLRLKARVKFVRADLMLFTKTGLEQSTDEVIARYKATRFPADAIGDLCCGIGGDAVFLASRGKVVGVDRCDVAAAVARHNANVYGHTVETRTADVTAASLDDFACWHLDPDRRAGGRRTVQLDHYSPCPVEWLRRDVNGAIKLAPATLAEEWEPWAELEWIETRGECRQQLAWSGQLAQHPGKRRAVVLREDGGVATLTGEVSSDVDLVDELDSYVYEPAAAVRAARLVDQLAQRVGLLRVSRQSSYLTGPLHHTDVARCYQVLEVMPFRPHRVAGWLRAHQIGRITVKKAGVDVDPAAVQKAWRNDAPDEATVILTPRINRKVVAIVCRPFTSSDEARHESV